VHAGRPLPAGARARVTHRFIFFSGVTQEHIRKETQAPPRAAPAAVSVRQAGFSCIGHDRSTNARVVHA